MCVRTTGQGSNHILKCKQAKTRCSALPPLELQAWQPISPQFGLLLGRRLNRGSKSQFGQPPLGYGRYTIVPNTVVGPDIGRCCACAGVQRWKRRTSASRLSVQSRNSTFRTKTKRREVVGILGFLFLLGSAGAFLLSLLLCRLCWRNGFLQPSRESGLSRSFFALPTQSSQCQPAACRRFRGPFVRFGLSPCGCLA